MVRPLRARLAGIQTDRPFGLRAAPGVHLRRIQGDLVNTRMDCMERILQLGARGLRAKLTYAQLAGICAKLGAGARGDYDELLDNLLSIARLETGTVNTHAAKR